MRSASSARAIRASVPVKDRPPSASTLTTALSPTLVKTTSLSGTKTTTRIKSVRLTVNNGCCPPSVGRADEGPQMKCAVGHDSVERGDDLGVFEIGVRPLQPRLCHSEIGLGLCGVGLSLVDGGISSQ